MESDDDVDESYDWSDFLRWIERRASTKRRVESDVSELRSALQVSESHFQAGTDRLHCAVVPPHSERDDVTGGWLSEVALHVAGSEDPPVVYCATSVFGSHHVLLRTLPDTLGVAAEERFRAAASTLGDGTESGGGGDVHMFVGPNEAGAQKKDEWWSKKYLKEATKKPSKKDAAKTPSKKDAAKASSKKDDPSAAYTHYRDTIDPIFLQALRDIVSDTSRLSSASPLAVRELCGGDGSLAAKVLAEHPSSSAPAGGVGSYTLFERNAALVEAAHTKLDGDARASIVRVDVTAEEGQALLATDTPSLAHVWLASGSTLNGQVGPAHFAAPTLRSMAASLAPGGRIVVAGFSRCHLTPHAIRRAGLRVLRASVPSSAADGLWDELGRYAFFVLAHALPTGDDADADDAVDATSARPLLRAIYGAMGDESPRVSCARTERQEPSDGIPDGGNDDRAARDGHDDAAGGAPGDAVHDAIAALSVS